ncbi:E3 ubiquitin-protein ligase TTC3 [Morone saxatilis]|uniref:E3 ubiquitin-protein ligase TTC3 n=1 Tax=Morone saxatilis TaxID=34816 RepID=UPI0015E1F19B|nr:E3 ubiquitin-protein ligase TTC3 [Morone saxatilis]
MSDSDSDSDCTWEDIRDRMTATILVTNKSNSIIQPPDEVFERWSYIPIDTRKEAAQRMKICAFWLPILLQREDCSAIAAWAFKIGLIDSNEDLSLRHLHKIETVEAVLRALEKGTLKKDQSKHVFWIRNMFQTRSPEVLEDALHWLERTGEPAIRHRIMELGHINICFTALQLIFTEFAKYMHEMGTNLEKTMKALLAPPHDHNVEKSEEMKRKGNENFNRQQYEDAVRFYSKAIKIYPDNHKFYGNRALCYVRCRKYLKAVGDGKRATLIEPLWAKGHYRYCEALFLLGEVRMAMEANRSAQSLCKGDQEGIRDLEQQHLKFMSQMVDPKVGLPKKTQSKRLESANRAHAPESRSQSVKGVHRIDPPANAGPQHKLLQNKLDKKPGKNERTAQMESSTKDSKPSKSEFSSKNGKGESGSAAKKKPRNKNSLSDDDETQKVDGSKAAVCRKLRSMVQDAHTALTDLRSRNAEQAFSQALALLETSTSKELGLSTLDVLLLLYGRASALTDIGQPEELGEAQKLLEKIKSFEERTFQCLVYYAIGRVYVRENRFAVALEQFSDSLQMVKNQITPGKLTWPFTKEIVKETQPDYFKVCPRCRVGLHTYITGLFCSMLGFEHLRGVLGKRVEGRAGASGSIKTGSHVVFTTIVLINPRASLAPVRDPHPFPPPTQPYMTMRVSEVKQLVEVDGGATEEIIAALLLLLRPGALQEGRGEEGLLVKVRHIIIPLGLRQHVDVHCPRGGFNGGDVGPPHCQVLLLHDGAQRFFSLQAQLPAEGGVQQGVPVKVPLQRSDLLLFVHGEQRGTGAAGVFDATNSRAQFPLLPPSSADHRPRPQHGAFSQMRVPVLVGAGRLFELPEEALGLRVDAQPTLTSRGASGRRLEVDPEPVLQSRVDLDRRHPPLLVRTAQETLGVLRVNLPETALPWLVLLPRHLDEALVERQVVLKKLKSKEEHRLKRKQHKHAFQDKQIINDEILLKKEDSATQIQQKAWLLYRDRYLLQISQNLELLREEKGLHVSVLASSLGPWLELDSSRGNQLAGRILNWQQEQLETLSQFVELLLERKNRVWARVLVQTLSNCLDINPKLSNWACQLNNAGLNAAKSFIERYSTQLEQLDLSFLLNFGPLQEVIIEKLGTRPELFSSIGLTVTEYLKQAPPDDMRLFIWTLEEHREEYVSCHIILEEYFDMMDGHCSVLKKSDENQNNSPMKSRGRKKKQKEPKGVFVWSGSRTVPREEWDQDLFEDDSLSFLHPGDPFSVPSHLREQVADFEDQYNGTRNRSHYKNILDNNPDPTKESLYDYFAQILEEHGPLVAEDPLLVGELEYFPPVAQQKIQEAGGFEPFLLESLRFIKMGRSIGLAKHAVSLQQAGHGPSLDELDDLDDLDDLDLIEDSNSADFQAAHDPAYTSHLDQYSSALTQVYSILPSPYDSSFLSAGGVTLTVNDPYSHWTALGNFLPNSYEELDLYSEEGEGGICDQTLGALATTEENFCKKHAAVQTCPEAMRSVAVNTELHERFESCQGDINKKQKAIKNLKDQILKMENSCDEINRRYQEELAFLEEEIHKISTNIQVTNKELVLFQQKLEEEVRKDQKEKKANQEVLKTLKAEMEELVEEHGSLSRSIREKKKNYDTRLKDFLELSNQSAAEKMSLEDEIKRCKVSFTSATRRSHTAQLSVMESSRDQGLYGLYRELTNAKALLNKLDEAVHRHPNQDLEMTRNSWRTNVQEIERKISAAETQYQEQKDQVKNGRRVSELLPVNVNHQSEPPAAPTSSTSHGSPTLPQQSAAEPAAPPPQMQHKPPTRPPEPAHSTVFDKGMERLSAMFPDYTRSDLMRFVQELRSSSGGSLASMALQDMVGGVTQLILDHQEKINSGAKPNMMGRRSPAQYAAPPYTAPVWQTFGPQRVTQSNALNVEDPCIICHDDMSPDDICVLECRHGFHKECIRSWLKEQSTCPTCRDHALLPEDFPVLPGKRRQAP